MDAGRWIGRGDEETVMREITEMWRRNYVTKLRLGETQEKQLRNELRTLLPGDTEIGKLSTV